MAAARHHVADAEPYDFFLLTLLVNHDDCFVVTGDDPLDDT